VLNSINQEAEAILLTEIFRAKGKEVLPRDKYELEDHTVKMPGTEFMEKISVLLEYYIRKRLNTDPKWKDIKVCTFFTLALAQYMKFIFILCLASIFSFLYILLFPYVT
jgi:hypothetical protein